MPTAAWNRRWALEFKRFARAHSPERYGLQWGDPSVSGLRYWWRKLRQGWKCPGDLSKVVKRYILPYVTPDSVALEIGAGGGRWTQYLLSAKKLILVEFNPEFFPYLEIQFREVSAKLQFYETTGYELDGIESGSVDFIFSFGTFVHLERSGIEMYFDSMRRVLGRGRVAVIHYADKSKPFFRKVSPEMAAAFSSMDRMQMEEIAARRGFKLLAHDTSLLNHSNIVVLENPQS